MGQIAQWDPVKRCNCGLWGRHGPLNLHDGLNVINLRKVNKDNLVARYLSARCLIYISLFLMFLFTCVPCVGERRRNAVCVRKSDHLEVSEQRCEHLSRPVAVTEPCNTDCEARCTLTTDTCSHKTNNFRPQAYSVHTFLFAQVACCWEE